MAPTRLRMAMGKLRVPAGKIAVCPLGQSSFLLKSPGGFVLALDPYLSNSCRAVGRPLGINMNRLHPPPLPPSELVGVHGYILTHTHADHLDWETLRPYRRAGGHGPYVGPPEVCEKLSQEGIPQSEIRMIWPNREVRIGDFALRATFAIPFGGDDLTHVGYLIRVPRGPVLYFTGDTRWHEKLPSYVKDRRPDVLFTVINPFGNLDPGQAAQLAKELRVRQVIPCHHDLFPDNSLPARLLHTNLAILGLGKIYRELPRGKFTVMAGR